MSVVFSSALILLFFGLLFPATPLAARSKNSSSSNSAAVNREYVAALASANRFLSAWQTQDREAGLIMLTDAAKHRVSEEQLQTFFEPGVVIQQGFEITRGKQLAAGRYIFPVTLFEIGPEHIWVHPRPSQIVVVNTGKEDWAIDKLP